MLKVLKDLRDGVLSKHPCDGVCEVIKINYGYVNLHELFKSWDEFSGDINFPVPSSGGNDSPFMTWCNCYDMWDKNSEYGRARWRLVGHMIAELEK
jgi:hypothetical protein